MFVSYKAIGLNIKKARLKANRTQEQLAEQINLSLLHYGRLERGQRPASLEQIARIANVLGVPTSSLLNGCVIDDYFDSVDASAQSLGDALAKLANGCSPTACKLMYTLCHAVAVSDKQFSD